MHYLIIGIGLNLGAFALAYATGSPVTALLPAIAGGYCLAEGIDQLTKK